MIAEIKQKNHQKTEVQCLFLQDFKVAYMISIILLPSVRIPALLHASVMTSRPSFSTGTAVRGKYETVQMCKSTEVWTHQGKGYFLSFTGTSKVMLLIHVQAHLDKNQEGRGILPS